MIESELIQLIGNVGFPIAITIYLLITRDNIIKSNTDSINRLSMVLEKHFFKDEDLFKPPEIPK